MDLSSPLGCGSLSISKYYFLLAAAAADSLHKCFYYFHIFNPLLSYFFFLFTQFYSAPSPYIFSSVLIHLCQVFICFYSLLLLVIFNVIVFLFIICYLHRKSRRISYIFVFPHIRYKIICCCFICKR